MTNARQTHAKTCYYCSDRLIMHRFPVCVSCRTLGSKALVVGGIVGAVAVKILSWWFGG